MCGIAIHCEGIEGPRRAWLAGALVAVHRARPGASCICGPRGTHRAVSRSVVAAGVAQHKCRGLLAVVGGRAWRRGDSERCWPTRAGEQGTPLRPSCAHTAAQHVAQADQPRAWLRSAFAQFTSHSVQWHRAVRGCPLSSALGRMATAASSIQAFEELALGFCAWSEGKALGPKAEVTASVWLARLHAAALLLPEVDPDNEDGLPELPPGVLAAAEKNFKPFAGLFYRTVFDPNPLNTEEPVMGDLGDDLLDIYKDIKAGCLLREQGRSQEALWHWSFMHEVHWGRHAVGALAALHGQRCEPTE